MAEATVQPWRKGPGVTRHPGPSPEVVAARLARMQQATKATRAARLAAQRAWLESLSGMPLEELKRSVPARQWSVAMFHCAGYDQAAIARALGYASGQSVALALKHPAVVRIVQLVRDAQVGLVLRGEYGVAAQAKAAAPEVMAHVVELAGARKPDAEGKRAGRAKRDSDALRAAELTLTVSGDKVERKATLHYHVLEEMSEAELEALAGKGEWPERYRGVSGLLPGPTEGES